MQLWRSAKSKVRGACAPSGQAHEELTLGCQDCDGVAYLSLSAPSLHPSPCPRLASLALLLPSRCYLRLRRIRASPTELISHLLGADTDVRVGHLEELEVHVLKLGDGDLLRLLEGPSHRGKGVGNEW